jgi:hypothetical protein
MSVRGNVGPDDSNLNKASIGSHAFNLESIFIMGNVSPGKLKSSRFDCSQVREPCEKQW